MATDLQSAKREVAEANRVVTHAGLAQVFTGHVSARVDDTVLIPAHLHDDGRGMESITPEHVVEVDLETGDRRPDAGILDLPDEAAIHTAIYDRRDDVKSAVHAHPLYATALSGTDKSILLGSIMAGWVGSVPVHDAGPRLIHGEAEAETPEASGAALAETLGDAKAALIRGHGVVTVGRSIGFAVAHLYSLERAAKLQLLAEPAGGVVPWEDPGEVMQPPGEELYRYLRRQHLDAPFE